MAIGQKTGSLKALKATLAGGGGGGAWIRYIPKNGSMNVRFLQEPEEWVNYNEHFDSALRKSFPCTNEQDCPGCMTQERRSNRYLANAVDLDKDRVIALQLPKDLANRLVVRYEKFGTLTDRDYELSRAGEGLDTTYDLDPSPPMKRRLTKYQSLDLMQVLQDAYDEVFGGGNGTTASPQAAAKTSTTTGPVKTRAKSSAAKVAKPVAEEDVDEDDEDEPEEPKPAPKRRAAAKKPEPKFEPEEDDEPDDEDEEPEEEPEEDEEDDSPEYDEDSLRALPLGALRAVARDFNVQVKGLKKEEIVQAILDAGEPVDEDEPPF